MPWNCVILYTVQQFTSATGDVLWSMITWAVVSNYFLMTLLSWAIYIYDIHITTATSWLSNFMNNQGTNHLIYLWKYIHVLFMLNQALTQYFVIYNSRPIFLQYFGHFIMLNLSHVTHLGIEKYQMTVLENVMIEQM